MTLLTLARYLFTGSPDAIRAIAGARGAVWVGLALVLSAGLAREYDGEYLPARAWVLLVPFGAAVAMATILFVPTYVAMGRSAGEGRPRAGAVYRAFVACFLLTAPLAWLYAIPYERFLAPLAATSANLWTLAVVSVWRVALMTRVLQVLTGRNFFPCLCAVMLIADVAMLIAIAHAPLPIFDVMGGLRLSDRERMVASATVLVQAGGVVSFFLWFFGAVYWMFIAEGRPLRVDALERRAVGMGVVAVAVLSVAAWALILPATQREQRLRHEAEAHLNAGRFAEAVAMMSRHGAGEFPPQWDPPPHVGRPGGQREDLLSVVEAILREPAAPWVAEVYAEKFERWVDSRWLFWTLNGDDERSRAAAERLRGIAERLPSVRPWDAARARVAALIEESGRLPATSPALERPPP